MLRITVELLPQGDASKARHLGTAEISNDGTGTSDEGNYEIRLSKWGRPRQTWRTGSITGFLRKRMGPWDLLLCCLVSAIGDRMKRWKKEPS